MKVLCHHFEILTVNFDSGLGYLKKIACSQITLLMKQMLAKYIYIKNTNLIFIKQKKMNVVSAVC